MTLDKPYLEHSVFEQLSIYGRFYEELAFSVMGFSSMGTSSLVNIDTYVFSSMKGTLELIGEILHRGRINDGYTLLRKFYDAAIINIYTNLYLMEHFSVENFIVNKIENWLAGKEHLPDIRTMKNYIKKSGKVTNIDNLLNKDKRYSDLRNRCNDHTHYNFYYNLLLNDNEIYLKNRISYLNRFSKDLENIFVLHLAYLFTIKDHYMMASDYLDCLDCGIEPDPESLFLVAPFVQEIFDNVLAKSRLDIAVEIKSSTSMKLK